MAEFKVIDAVNGFYAHRQVEYRDYSFVKDSLANVVLNFPGSVMEHDNSTRRAQEYWTENRIAEVSPKEQSVDQMMREPAQQPCILLDGKGIDIPLHRLDTYQRARTARILWPCEHHHQPQRVGGLSLAHGSNDIGLFEPPPVRAILCSIWNRGQKVQIYGRGGILVQEKKEHPNEFPIHSVKMRYENDIFQYGQNYLHTNKDNIFLSLKRKKDDKIGYIKRPNSHIPESSTTIFRTM